MKRKKRLSAILIALVCLFNGSCLAQETTPTEEEFRKLRMEMVDQLVYEYGIKDKRVIEAMRKVPRHKLVPLDMRPHAYEDRPLPIGEGQTISQPYIVALMTQLLDLKGGEKVLEVGTGSGYQAAVLAEIVGHVYTIEIVEPLAKRAEKDLKELGYKNITVKCGDGYQGWKEHAPFDAVIVTAAPEHVPQPLIDQLKEGGRLVIPVGPQWVGQDIVRLTKTKDGVKEEKVLAVRFVPMTGEAEKKGKE
ncbi:MAG: protein-L-isoaspartate(D-aspartate) O-methyltransferase [Planctomycetes bacterium]|nr:protein-L-isoaspartate(D-aspartate) O-methyltransferase [Planctomycetota bacterium]